MVKETVASKCGNTIEKASAFNLYYNVSHLQTPAEKLLNQLSICVTMAHIIFFYNILDLFVFYNNKTQTKHH